MTSTKRDRSVVVIELQGGNDALNTVIPYNNGLYYDFRSGVGIPQADVIKLDDEVGLNPSLTPMKDLWTRVTWRSSTASATPTPTVPTSAPGDVWYTAESEKMRCGGLAGGDQSATWTHGVRTS